MELYGMRCPGEIDISNTRWWEAPTLLVPSIINHMKSNAPGNIEIGSEGRKEAEEAVQKLLERISNTCRKPQSKTHIQTSFYLSKFYRLT